MMQRFRASSTGQLLPVHRVKAWRFPNEDRPTWDIVLRRAVPAISLPTTEELRKAIDFGAGLVALSRLDSR